MTSLSNLHNFQYTAFDKPLSAKICVDLRPDFFKPEATQDEKYSHL
jgi:hypothetical protein